LDIESQLLGCGLFDFAEIWYIRCITGLVVKAENDRRPSSIPQLSRTFQCLIFISPLNVWTVICISLKWPPLPLPVAMTSLVVYHRKSQVDRKQQTAA